MFPQQNPGQVPTQNPGQQPVAATPPQPGAPPQGAPQGGAPMVHVPPEIARHINPNDAIQQLLLQRINKLAPQEGAALDAGISPQAAQVLKKILPEIGFLLDMLHGGQPGGAPMPQQGGAPPAPGGAPMPPQGMPQGGAPRGLSRF